MSKASLRDSTATRAANSSARHSRASSIARGPTSAWMAVAGPMTTALWSGFEERQALGHLPQRLCRHGRVTGRRDEILCFLQHRVPAPVNGQLNTARGSPDVKWRRCEDRGQIPGSKKTPS